MKNKKGQMDIGIGTIMVVFIAILIGIIFVQAIAQSVGESINTVAVANESLGIASNDTTVYLTNYRAISDVVIVNSTNGVIIGSGNYTLTNNVVYNGALAVSVLPTTPSTSGLGGYVWNISGTAQPTGYITDSAGRTMASLIVIMFALAVAVIALTPTLQSKVLDMMGR